MNETDADNELEQLRLYIAAVEIELAHAVERGDEAEAAGAALERQLARRDGPPPFAGPAAWEWFLFGVTAGVGLTVMTVWIFGG